ncbi:MAG: hypothetical protein M1837_005001 [Sclerophora amabilis]|nr:MAG: hypothetical protein M1837_005001 [Sclerophora amabilis]
MTGEEVVLDKEETVGKNFEFVNYSSIRAILVKRHSAPGAVRFGGYPVRNIQTGDGRSGYVIAVGAIVAEVSSSPTPTTSAMEDSLSSSRLLSSSISSLSTSKSSRGGSSEISRTYRQASSLFLTRRIAEALSALEPIIASSTHSPGQETRDGFADVAPIASASKSSRIKVWSLYLTILDAIINLGPEEGRNTFGSKTWRALLSKAQEGKVWEEIVQEGYGGVEGDVDADVVINLYACILRTEDTLLISLSFSATLLLTHAPSQSLNQQRLENYLSASAHPNLDISERFQSQSTPGEFPTMERRPSAQRGGTNTPRDLNSRIQILELYTLHVLPRNDEWDYAREFINISEVLDEERRESFLQTIKSLQDEKFHRIQKENDMERQQSEQVERDKQESKAREAEDTPRVEAELGKRRNGASAHKRTSSETDYGIESHPNPASRTQPSKKGTKTKPVHSTGTQLSPNSQSPKAAKKSRTPSNLYDRASAMVASLHDLITSVAQSMKTNPLLLLRTLLFLMGFILALSRRDMRDRIRRITSNGWNKVRGTVGMGVKVSYI